MPEFRCDLKQRPEILGDSTSFSWAAAVSPAHCPSSLANSATFMRARSHLTSLFRGVHSGRVRPLSVLHARSSYFRACRGIEDALGAGGGPDVADGIS
jgi:hypothetical protein